MRPNEYDDLLSKIKCSDEFRGRMEEKLSSPAAEVHEYEETVSGTDVITAKHSWGRIAAMAAAFVLVCGAVGGGAYYRFSHVKNITDTSSNEDKTEYDSIYDRLKANRDKYEMSTAPCVFDGAEGGFSGFDSEEQQRFFDYMDKFNMKNEVEKKDISITARHIKFVFFKKNNEENEVVLDFYESGDCTWTESDNGAERTTYHSLADGDMVFNDLMKMYQLDTICSDMLNWNNVNEEEIEDFIEKSYENSIDYTSSLMNAASFHQKASSNIKMYEFADRNDISSVILSCEWERARDFDYINGYYSINGFNLSEDGYLSGNYKGYYVVYKLKDDIYLDKLRTIWNDYLKPMYTAFNISDPKDIREALQQISGEKSVQWLEGPTYIGQGSTEDYDCIARYYTLSDTKGFIDELASLAWVSCSDDEITDKSEYRNERGLIVSKGVYEFNYMRLYPDGYMRISNVGGFKLENESDIEKLSQLIDNYLIMDEGSKTAEKIRNGITDYNNLKAHYTYELSDGSEVSESVSGYLSVDAKNEKMYMTFDGISNFTDIFADRKNVSGEIVMNGHDDSAFRMVLNDTGEVFYSGIYSYSNGYLTPPPFFHYIYFCESLEKSFAPREAVRYYDSDYDSDFNFEIIEADGLVTLYSEGENDGEYIRIVLTERGQLISYEKSSENYSSSFILDDYVFDSPDFTMEDVGTVYERIGTEREELDSSLNGNH